MNNPLSTPAAKTSNFKGTVWWMLLVTLFSLPCSYFFICFLANFFESSRRYVPMIIIICIVICVLLHLAFAALLFLKKGDRAFRIGMGIFFFVYLLVATCFYSALVVGAKQYSARFLRYNVENFRENPNLVAFWDFSEDQGLPKCSVGKEQVQLREYGDPIPVVEEGPFSGRSIQLQGNSYLSLPYAETGALNVSNNMVTVIAWIQWEGNDNSFVGGMWNEYQEGGKRQYGLFVSLPHYNGAKQVCGHISKTGGPTVPLPFSMDYSASAQTVPTNRWCCVGFTYDGVNIRSYLDGEFVARPAELINNTQGFYGNTNGVTLSKNPYQFLDGIGNNGSDFTVGAVQLKRGMGNFFRGKIGGLAVFDTPLSQAEMSQIAIMPQPKKDNDQNDQNKATESR